MDAILQIFINWQFLMFGMAIAAVVYVFRKIMEFFISSISTNKTIWLWKFWNELLLPIAPVVFGVVSALCFKTYPYPDGLTTEGDRIIFGLVAGLLSTLFYRIVKAMLVQKIQSVLPSNSLPLDNIIDTDPVADDKIVINQVKQIINKQ